MDQTNAIFLSKKILIVDDDNNILQLLKYLFELKGHKASTASDGEEALKKAEDMPDLIILDLGLPKLSGEEVCKKIRHNEKTKNIPIIMLTGKYSDTDRIVGKVIGANYYIAKPCDMNELSLASENALGTFHTTIS